MARYHSSGIDHCSRQTFASQRQAEVSILVPPPVSRRGRGGNLDHHTQPAPDVAAGGQIFPLCIATMLRQMARPKPLPR